MPDNRRVVVAPASESTDLVADTPSGDAIDAARWSARLAKVLLETDGLQETLQQVVDLTSEILDADLVVLVGIGRNSATPELLASTDYQMARRLVDMQRSAGDSPSWTAIRERATVVVQDFTAETRWREYAEKVVANTPIRAMVAPCLLIGGKPLAAMAAYGYRPEAFDQEQVDLAGVIADHAAISFHEAALADLAEQLQIALDHARDIGAAIGIVMERLRVTQREAFGLLRKASQDRNRKLFELATELVETGEVPFAKQ